MKFYMKFIICLVCVIKACDSRIQDCRSRYVNNGYIQFEGGLYKLHRTPQCWAGARSICDTEGAHLAIINSPSEANFLVSLMNAYPADTLMDITYKDSLLIGFHDFFCEGEYVTLDGKDLETSGYYLWEAGQPNSLPDQNCGSISRRGLLNDFPCSIPSLFVCEAKARTLCENLGRIRPRKQNSCGYIQLFETMPIQMENI